MLHELREVDRLTHWSRKRVWCLEAGEAILRVELMKFSRRSCYKMNIKRCGMPLLPCGRVCTYWYCRKCDELPVKLGIGQDDVDIEKCHAFNCYRVDTFCCIWNHMKFDSVGDRAICSCTSVARGRLTWLKLAQYMSKIKFLCEIDVCETCWEVAAG